ncbi:MAG: ribosomal L7Ae/L30e/S12e/Gadd45 family protein [Gemmatimonadetes bacterium]|nr:ribosomal L7Ae/L30e/S12e/Gadd45 family protein [Gemmatimonadota bacterium]
MTDTLIRLLGLGIRARRVVIGVAGVRAKLQAGDLACVVLAADASSRTRDKVERLARARGIPVWRGPAAERLGAGLGRPAVQAVGVRDPALARGLAASFGGVSGNDADS